jgi:putative membrane protein
MTEKDLGLTDRLALDRTHLANQRTLLAFTRTGIYFVFTGLGIFHIIKLQSIFWLAWGAIGLGTIIAIIGLVNYLRMKRRVGRLYQ